MSTVLRVKRRFDEEPIEALMISCKKRKLDTAIPLNIEEPITTVLKFVATVKDQNDPIVKHLPPAHKAGLKSLLEHKPDITKKLKNDIENKSKENRLKVVNCFRALHNETDDDEKDEENKSKITVVDIEKQQPEKQENSDQTPDDNDLSYVYDLYYSDNPSRETCSPDFSDIQFENWLSVHAVNIDDLVNEEDIDEDNPMIENLDIDEDSNDEGNWRNDYPDSDNSISEDDMRLAANFQSLSIERDGDNEYGNYSSEDENEGLAWSNDTSLEDIQRYGYSYATYKKNHLVQESDSEEEEELNDLYYSIDEIQ